MSLSDIEFLIFKADVQPVYDSDAIDRLRYFLTSATLVAASLLIMSKQYVGESVQCWLPKQFKGGWEEYAETYCLIENTYFVGMNESNLPDQTNRENMEMRYYQWVPFILLAMAFALYLPRIIWKSLQTVIGIDISIITSYLRNNAKSNLDASSNIDVEKRRKEVETTYRTKTPNGAFWGSRFTISLLTTKIFATIIILLSMLFMDYFVGIGAAYGWRVTMNLINGRQWQESGTFPRVTFCDFEVRELGYVNNWTLQCVLMVNMFNEKLFVFLWWWYLVLAILSFFDIIRFFYRFTTRHQIDFIHSILSFGNESEYVTKTEVSEFNRKVLQSDGIHLIHLIYSNATIFEAEQFIRPLWNDFKSNKN